MDKRLRRCSEFLSMISWTSLKSSLLRFSRKNLVSSSILGAVPLSTFSQYFMMSEIKVRENSSMRENHRLQKSSSLLPIDGSKSKRSPLGITFVLWQSFRNSIWLEYRSALSRIRSKRMIRGLCLSSVAFELPFWLLFRSLIEALSIGLTLMFSCRPTTIVLVLSELKRDESLSVALISGIGRWSRVSSGCSNSARLRFCRLLMISLPAFSLVSLALLLLLSSCEFRWLSG